MIFQFSTVPRTSQRFDWGKLMHRYFIFLFVFFFYGCLCAQPSLPHVINGSVDFSLEGNKLLIQTQSDKTVINWDKFSIGSKEITHFLQPSAHSATLNRVLSSAPSEILGTLTSNGVVFLINPNGILVGPGGQIDVNGLVASTLDIDNELFMRDQPLLFSGDSKAVIENLGLIKGGKEGVFLIGRHLVNQGDILATNSEVHFGGGNQVLVKMKEKHIYIHPDLEGEAAGIGVDQKGKIDASKLDIQVDGNLYELAIRHIGEAKALHPSERDGEIYLVANGGEVQVSETGCLHADKKIHLIGEQVTLLDDTKIQSEEAGEIVVGGLPGNENVATYTAIGQNVSINSNLSATGDGGEVTVYGSKGAAFYGTIDA